MVEFIEDRAGGGGGTYLSLHLVKTMFIPEKIGIRYLCAHPIFSGFHQPWRKLVNMQVLINMQCGFSVYIFEKRGKKDKIDIR